MRRLASLLALATLLLAPAVAFGGDIVGFQPGRPAAPVLPHTKLRAVVAEFLDPGNTGLGKSLAWLLWREILTAIADQAGAGVILARAPGGTRLVDLLQERYHESALEAAKGQAARMALWGVVEEEGGRLFVGTYLSILPDARNAELMLRLVTPGAVINGRDFGNTTEGESGRVHGIKWLDINGNGTREQLFLAVRLALIRDFAERGIELPLVLDDVVVNFDEERTAAAARVLRDFADEGLQVLVFTCHRHLAQTFESLGAEPVRLPGPSPDVLHRRVG